MWFIPFLPSERGVQRFDSFGEHYLVADSIMCSCVCYAFYCFEGDICSNFHVVFSIGFHVSYVVLIASTYSPFIDSQTNVAKLIAHSFTSADPAAHVLSPLYARTPNSVSLTYFTCQFRINLKSHLHWRNPIRTTTTLSQTLLPVRDLLPELVIYNQNLSLKDGKVKNSANKTHSERHPQ